MTAREVLIIDYGMMGCELRDFQPDGKVNDYECPECQKVLFSDEEEAMSFIKGD